MRPTLQKKLEMTMIPEAAHELLCKLQSFLFLFHGSIRLWSLGFFEMLVLATSHATAQPPHTCSCQHPGKYWHSHSLIHTPLLTHCFYLQLVLTCPPHPPVMAIL